MIGIARHAVAHDFGMDGCAARLGVLELLENHDARTLAHDEAIAVPVIGARALLRRIVELGRERLAGDEARDAKAADGRFGAARDHDIGIVERDDAGRIADGVRARRAGRDHRVVRALAAELDRDQARGEIDERARNEERADAARSLLVHQEGGVRDVGEAADAGADEHAGAVLLVLGGERDA